MLALVNGLIADGSGGEPYRGSVLCDGEQILEAGPAVSATAEQTIDCDGLVIAPGFLDLHSHSDLQALDPRRLEKAKQGVTAEMVGNCGFSAFPSGPEPERVREFAKGIFREGEGWRWSSARDYLADVASRGGATDLYALVGHGTLRVAVAGMRQSITPEEQQSMRYLLATALYEGCAGFSTGLMYAPGSSAGPDELQPMLSLVTASDKLYATHMRGYANTLLPALREQISMARNTGCRIQISHLQAAGRANWPFLPQALEEIETARRDGIDVEFDIYPYQCGSTVLTQWLPRWALDGGTDEMCSRLANPEERHRIREEVEASIAQSWDDITITGVALEANAPLVGLTLSAIGKKWAVEPVEAMLDLLLVERGAVNVVSFNQSEDNLRTLLTHPLCSVISDGFYVRGLPHPRLHGTFPELLGKVVREKRWMTLADAVHKITAKPYSRIKVHDRGLVRKGYRADLVAFDPDRIGSPATYDKPEQDPTGIVAVIRGGKQVSGAN